MVLFCLSYGIGQQIGDVSIPDLEQSLVDIRELIGVNEEEPTQINDNTTAIEDSLTTGKNTIAYTGFFLQADTAHTTDLHKLTATRAVTVFGSSFTTRGDLFITGGQVDGDRSGISLDFDPVANLQALLPKYSTYLQDRQGINAEDLISSSQRFAQAKLSLLFDRYLEIVNSDAYASYVDSINAQRSPLDSLAFHRNEAKGKVGDISSEVGVLTNSLSSKIVQLKKFRDNYEQLYTVVRGIPYNIRSHASGIMDSLVVTGRNGIEDARQLLAQHHDIRGFRRHLLFVKDLGIGNTAMGQEETTSIGLPIRGLSYAYDDGVLRAEVQAGRRILPRRQYLPVEGILFPSTDRNTFLFRALAGVTSGEHTKFALSYLRGRETNAVKEQIAPYTRHNNVMTASGEIAVVEGLRFVATFSYSLTSLRGSVSGPSAPTISADSALWNQSATKAGVVFGLKSMELRLSGFNTGANYTTLANPYLLTDLRGGEVAISGTAVDGKLGGELRFSFGYGTTELTRDNYQWQGLGVLRYRLGNRHSIGVMATPNIFRVAIDGSEGSNTNNIYQLDLSGQFGSVNRPSSYRISASNLDSGFNWGDTTQVSTATQLTVDLSAPVNEVFSVTGSGVHRVGSETSEWSYAFTLGYAKMARHDLSIRYEQYAFSSPGWGIGYAISAPLSKSISIQANLYGHLNGHRNNSIYSSQQSILSKF